MKTFIEEIIDVSDEYNQEVEELKTSEGAVVLFGGGIYALEVEKYLNNYGIIVDAFFVDDGYQNSNSNLVKVITFSEVLKQFNKFSIITANIRKRFEFNSCDQIIGVYTFDCLFLEKFAQFNYNYINKHKIELETVYNNLNDNQSKETFCGYIKTKITHNSKYLGQYYKDQYFCNDIVSLSKNEVFVDGGAFTGDTLLLFAEKTNNKFEKYYAFEPDAENFSKLKDLKKRIDNRAISIIQKGLWENFDIVKFFGGGTDSGVVSEEGDKEIIVDSIDNLCPDATFIVMDVEGSELKALKGAEKTIIKNRPKLAICIYHKPEDLFEIPLYIKSICPEYRFYIRQHWQNISRELVLYAIFNKEF